jgi:hypothetical protein
MKKVNLMYRFLKYSSIFLVVFAATLVLAANPHFVGQPAFTLNANNTVTASGSIAGLGNQNITVVLTAALNVEVICHNPSGNIAPGQTQQTTATGSQSDIRVENGRAFFNVTTAAPTLSGTPKQLGCPNNKWTPVIGDVEVTGALLQVFQGGRLVLSQSFNL